MEWDFSREFKEQIVLNRHNDWVKFELWLKERSISYTKGKDSIQIFNRIVVYSNMKVSFGSSKRYQYNLEGIKDRILNGRKN